MRVLVDGDVYAYACGFIAQAKTSEGEIVAEPVENALALVKTGLRGIWKEVETWMDQSGEKCEYLEIFLTGKDNFRDKLGTIKKYKANRIGKAKPIHYQAIRDYMTGVWGAKVVDGHEADDELAIQACSEGYDPDRVMICSVDKDLKTVPGLIYNFDKKWAFLVSEQEASGNFYRQMITGDSADNIGGVYRSGEVAAGCILDNMPEEIMWEQVLGLFRESLKRPRCPYDNALDAAIETARLLHLLRYPGQVWVPPTDRSIS